MLRQNDKLNIYISVTVGATSSANEGHVVRLKAPVYSYSMDSVFIIFHQTFNFLLIFF